MGVTFVSFGVCVMLRPETSRFVHSSAIFFPFPVSITTSAGLLSMATSEPLLGLLTYTRALRSRTNGGYISYTHIYIYMHVRVFTGIRESKTRNRLQPLLLLPHGEQLLFISISEREQYLLPFQFANNGNILGGNSRKGV